MSTEHRVSILLNYDITLTLNTFVGMTGMLTLHTFMSVQKSVAVSLECFFQRVVNHNNYEISAEPPAQPIF